MHCIVHSSLKSVGQLHGDTPLLIEALQEVLTSEGTLVMPSYTSGNSNPMHWKNPPAPQSEWETIKKHMQPFNSLKTPSFAMGRIAESFRSFPGVLRSNHLSVSFSAWGKWAKHLTENHALIFY